MDKPVDDFIWCPVQWDTGDGPTWTAKVAHHRCAEFQPGHRVHKCCCGEVEGI